MDQMSGQRRVRASWLLVVLFATMSLGVCTALLSHDGGNLTCCADVTDGQSLTSCCKTGQQSSSSEVPVGRQAPLPRASEITVAVAPETPAHSLSRLHSSANVLYRSADPQALLSTFLI